MGSLKDMIGFLENSIDKLNIIVKKLDSVQNHFNSTFSSIRLMKDSEMRFLQDSFFSNKESFPVEVQKLYKNELPVQTKKFEQQLMEMEKKRDELEKQLNRADIERQKILHSLEKSNVTLDKREEKLKVKIEELEKEIADYNKTIDELNSGFGIIINLFRMRKIDSKKDAIIDKRSDIKEKLEKIRDKWVSKTEEEQKKEDEVKELWLTVQTEYSIVVEKILELKKRKDELIEKAAFLEVIRNLSGDEDFLKSVKVENAPDHCGTCKVENKNNRFFCKSCGNRFFEDRKEVLPSLVESGELNNVYDAYLEGIKGSVSILALMKGIKTGAEEFKKSVVSVKSSQDKYSALPKLKISIPDTSLKMTGEIVDFVKMIDEDKLKLHPLEVSEKLGKHATATFTDAVIESFFNKMGEELNKRTEDQW